MYGIAEQVSSTKRVFFYDDIINKISFVFDIYTSDDVKAYLYLNDKDSFVCFHPDGDANNLIMARGSYTTYNYKWYKLFN